MAQGKPAPIEISQAAAEGAPLALLLTVSLLCMASPASRSLGKVLVTLLIGFIDTMLTRRFVSHLSCVDRHRQRVLQAKIQLRSGIMPLEEDSSFLASTTSTETASFGHLSARRRRLCCASNSLACCGWVAYTKTRL